MPTDAGDHAELPAGATADSSAPPAAMESPRRAECRRGHAFLTGHLSRESFEALKDHLKEIKATTGGRVTIEDVIAAGVAMFFVATGKPPPTEELRAALRPYMDRLTQQSPPKGRPKTSEPGPT